MLTQPFVMGIFCGKQKPADVDEYPGNFVKEMKNLEHQAAHVGGFIHPLKAHNL